MLRNMGNIAIRIVVQIPDDDWLHHPAPFCLKPDFLILKGFRLLSKEAARVQCVRVGKLLGTPSQRPYTELSPAGRPFPPRLPMRTGIFAVLLFTTTLAAADWPQFRGPERNGISKETGLLKTWPKEGPPLLWSYKNAGLGFAGPAIVGDRLYTMGAFKDQESVICLSVKENGRMLWATPLGPSFTFEGNLWGDGPRSTPTVDGDFVYALGAQGELACLSKNDGKIVWRKNMIKDFGGAMMEEGDSNWGYSESPLIDGDLLICTPGSEKNGTVIALDKKTGAVKWQCGELKHRAPYTSVVVADIGGVRQYIQTSYVQEPPGGFISGIEAKTGKLLWTESIFKRSSYAIASTPIIKGNSVYVTSGYGGGCHRFEISKDGAKFKAEEKFSKKNQKSMKNTHGGVVLIGDHIYGHSEVLGWVCQDFKTGDITWNDANQLECNSGAICAANGQLYLFSDEGEVALLDPDTQGWTEKGRFKLPEASANRGARARPSFRSAQVWVHPVIADGKLYLRDQELLFCYDVREKK